VRVRVCVLGAVDMLPFGVTIPATVPQRSDIPEGLMNCPVKSTSGSPAVFYGASPSFCFLFIVYFLTPPSISFLVFVFIFSV